MRAVPPFLIWVCLGMIGIGLVRDFVTLDTSGVATPFFAIRLLAEPPDQKITMPVQGIRVRQIANTWNAPRVGHRHQGQDIFARRGTPVLAATEGLVIRVGNAGIGGNAVSVLGAGGRVYYYAHLAAFANGVRPGLEVSPGSVLGFVGNTGNARGTPPHLHFGIYSRSGAINPLPLLEDRTS